MATTELPDSIFVTNSKYIAVIGDIQSYTVSDEMTVFLKETCYWLHSQQRHFDCFSCVLQDGDLTENNFDYQWNLADEAFGYLGDSLVCIPSTGNHDYTWGKNSEISDRYSNKLNSMNNLSVLKRQQLEQFELGRLDNIIVPVKVGKDSISIIALEFGPRKEAVTWADSIVRANPNRKYILMTHEWMSAKGQRIDTNSYATWQMPNLSHSTPQEIWDKMVYPNDNILCVLCGHNGFCKYLYSTNKAGRDVCQILFNLQYQENGGDGMIQLWEFPNDKNVINISVYNTIKREFHADPETRISIQL
ncbi:MAG: hypothetical protein K2G11_05735 [Muribaculaceae bacterium]|nr:hypothetical protein [Muribaculaceae bacterium]